MRMRQGAKGLQPLDFSNGHCRAKSKPHSGKTTVWFSGKQMSKYSGNRPQPPARSWSRTRMPVSRKWRRDAEGVSWYGKGGGGASRMRTALRWSSSMATWMRNGTWRSPTRCCAIRGEASEHHLHGRQRTSSFNPSCPSVSGGQHHWAKGSLASAIARYESHRGHGTNY